MAQTHDLLILDVGLSHMSGLKVLKCLRSRGVMLPVLILAAADSVEGRVKGLDPSTGNYMAKPFVPSELETRVRALVRRGTDGDAMLVRHGPPVFDQAGRIVYIHDQVVELLVREIRLLETLLACVSRLVSKGQLVDHLCGWGEEVSNDAIEVYIHRLRREIEVGGIRIATMCGLGYCLERMATPTTTTATHG